ncbi:MAG: hypothetical protein K2Y37_03660 [Pirellulales bacterium]|nr:hypothetical protein [Pirellulales bacterium]
MGIRELLQHDRLKYLMVGGVQVTAEEAIELEPHAPGISPHDGEELSKFLELKRSAETAPGPN